MRVMLGLMLVVGCGGTQQGASTTTPRPSVLTYPTDSVSSPSEELVRLRYIASHRASLRTTRRLAARRATALLETIYMRSPRSPRAWLDVPAARAWLEIATELGEPDLAWFAVVALPEISDAAPTMRAFAETSPYPCPRAAFLHFAPAVRLTVRLAGLAPDVPPTHLEVEDPRFEDVFFLRAAMLDALARRDAPRARRLAARVNALAPSDMAPAFVLAATSGAVDETRLDVLVSYTRVLSNASASCRSPAAVHHLLSLAPTDEAAFLAATHLDLVLHGDRLATRRMAPPPADPSFAAVRAALTSPDADATRAARLREFAPVPERDGHDEPRRARALPDVEVCQSLDAGVRDVISGLVVDGALGSAAEIAVASLSVTSAAGRACLEHIAGPDFETIETELIALGLGSEPLGLVIPLHAHVRPELYPAFLRAAAARANALSIPLPDEPEFFRIAAALDAETLLEREVPEVTWHPATARIETGDEVLDALFGVVRDVHVEESRWRAEALADVADLSSEPYALRTLAESMLEVHERIGAANVAGAAVSFTPTPTVDPVTLARMPACRLLGPAFSASETERPPSPADRCTQAIQSARSDVAATCSAAFAGEPSPALVASSAEFVRRDHERDHYHPPTPERVIVEVFPTLVARFSQIPEAERSAEVWAALTLALGRLGQVDEAMRVRLLALTHNVVVPADGAAFDRADTLAPYMVLLGASAPYFALVLTGLDDTIDPARAEEENDGRAYGARAYVGAIVESRPDVSAEELRVIGMPPELLTLDRALAIARAHPRDAWALPWLARVARGSRDRTSSARARVARLLERTALPDDEDDAAVMLALYLAAYERLGASDEIERLCRNVNTRFPEIWSDDGALYEICEPHLPLDDADDASWDEESY